MRKLLLAAATLSSSLAFASLELDSEYYISVSRLNVRSSELISGQENVLGQLRLNDKVRVVSYGDNQDDQMVEIEVTYSKYNNLIASKRMFTSQKYLLDAEAVKPTFKGEYFIIQNIATERLRVYKRSCLDNSCPHKMVAEIEMVAGEDKDGTRTILGSYKITGWRKFYEDGKANYPSWYNKDYPMPPSDKKGVFSWFKKKYMPFENGKRKGSMRGAFGWYAGFMGPNSDAQWMHGTIGWGAKSKYFINRTKKFWANVFSDPRSHGCSRVDNLSISYLKHLIPVGTPVVKVYAKEALLNQNLDRYQEKTIDWDYILTTNPGMSSDRDYVLSKDVPNKNILEEGVHTVDLYPNILKYKKAGRMRNRAGKAGNIYDLEEENFTDTGVFYIDAGMFKKYKHPTSPKIIIGGYEDEIIPEFMKITELDK